MSQDPCCPCPPPTPPTCGQTCAPPPPLPPCRPKPIMKGLHAAQTKMVIMQALILSLAGGACYYFFIGRPRREAYADYYRKLEIEEMASEMTKKGLFQAVPRS